MSVWQIVLGVVIGFLAGVFSGVFGVGGGIITTPVVRLLGGTAIQAVATPLPVIVPTALTGAYTYWKAGEVSERAIRWGVAPGAAGAIGGALLTSVTNAHVLLIVTAGLLAIQSVRIASGRSVAERERGATPGWQYLLAGGAAGFVSGLLGVGGGIVYVPVAATMLGMPIKRALGTSLVLISIVAVPGTIVHAALGHVDWAIFAVLVAGVVPGARIGAAAALRARDRSLRVTVGLVLFAIALGYAAFELFNLLAGRS